MKQDLIKESYSEFDKTWPFIERRHPTRKNPDYLGSKGLSEFLQKIIKKEINDQGLRNLNLLDIGCGEKPFYPFFQQFSSEYIGTDIIKGDHVDFVCPVENLLIEDNWADVVICFSVLEHVCQHPTFSTRSKWSISRFHRLELIRRNATQRIVGANTVVFF